MENAFVSLRGCEVLFICLMSAKKRKSSNSNPQHYCTIEQPAQIKTIPIKTSTDVRSDNSNFSLDPVRTIANVARAQLLAPIELLFLHESIYADKTHSGAHKFTIEIISALFLEILFLFIAISVSVSLASFFREFSERNKLSCCMGRDMN